MRSHRILGLMVLLLLQSPLQSAWAEESAKVSQSRESALAWLALIDNDQIEQSWSEASSLFRQAVTAGDWRRALAGARAPLGELLERSFIDATYAESLPGAPDGEYVVMQFEASFAKKASAVETVTTMLDEDGAWRVSGYFIR